MSHSSRTAAIATWAAFLLSGCDDLFVDQVPQDVVTPSVTGVVASRDRQDDGLHVRLEDGTTVMIPARAEMVEGSIEEGQLLVYGDDPLPRRSDGPWYVAISPLPSGCFRLPANGEVRGDRMALSYGFSVPLSDDWQETETRFVSRPAKGFCLDDSGAATRPYS